MGRRIDPLLEAERELAAFEDLAAYADGLVARLAETHRRFQATVRDSKKLRARTAAQRRWSPT